MELFPHARHGLAELAKAAGRIPFASRGLWLSRLAHVYGDMQGQRKVDVSDLRARLRLDGDILHDTDILIALETYFFLICNTMALAWFSGKPTKYFADLQRLPVFGLKSLLDNLVSGGSFEDEGILGMGCAFEFDWISECCSGDSLVQLRDSLSSLGSLLVNTDDIARVSDPLQVIHHSLFPKNLLHITGQFYTPEWLADLLLEDLIWTPDERLVDPFCGSGVFLVRALSYAAKGGNRIEEILPNLLGIDLNPVACVAARCNLATFIARSPIRPTSKVSLNIISADALSPSVLLGQRLSDPLELSSEMTFVDGEYVEVSRLDGARNNSDAALQLQRYGLDLKQWKMPCINKQESPKFKAANSARDRRIWEQLFAFQVRPADVLITNPPWVGWEYISRPYRAFLTPAWQAYDLFKARGMEAAFLKEDLSSLALLAAWDRYLSPGGKSAVVLRPASMFSDLAGRGVRRLSLRDLGDPLELQKIRTFSGLKVFESAATETASWLIRKGQETTFPVPVCDWRKNSARWNPSTNSTLDEVKLNIRPTAKQMARTAPKDSGSRWIVAEAAELKRMDLLQGTNEYVPRMGVFTGGANAVFYLDILGESTNGSTYKCRNIIERARRPVGQVTASIERELVYSVLRGRDIEMWHADPKVHLLCPHTMQTRMTPMDEQTMRLLYPKAFQYLLSMREALSSRQGFAGWERNILEKYFYALQRIGEYTFSQYKVCWKYIASEFTVCVINGDNSRKPVLPNDKVMFIPFSDKDAAYFVAGVLSSSQVRRYVDASASKRQISTNVIKSLRIPNFDPNSILHRAIANCCLDGHVATSSKDAVKLGQLRASLDGHISGLFAAQ